jgi:aryl-alcohol dehydrogenase-like predicted oxidoreductase
LEKRKLGNTNYDITIIGFGSWAIGGGKWAFGWGPQDDRHAIEAIHKSLELGVNWIDTAAVYGLGHSEMLIAQALSGMSNKPYVFTKCGLVWDENRHVTNRIKAASIRKECEDSLRRLKVDVIDLYQMHWPNPNSDIEEGWEEMARLKEEGKVKYIGVSNYNVEQMRRALKIAPISTLQPPYSLLSREVENDILPFCHANGIGVIVYSPMASGLLTGTMTSERIMNFPEDDWRKHSPKFLEPQLSFNLEIAAKLKEIASKYGRSAGEAAIAWVLRNPAVTAAIVGGRSAEQVEGIIGAADLALSEEDIEEIESMPQFVK